MHIHIHIYIYIFIYNLYIYIYIYRKNAKVTQEEHDVFQTWKNKKNKKVENILKTKKKGNYTQKQKQKQNQEDQQRTDVMEKGTMTKPKTFNLSNKVLSQQHVNVPRRGLKFTPTP